MSLMSTGQKTVRTRVPLSRLGPTARNNNYLIQSPSAVTDAEARLEGELP